MKNPIKLLKKWYENYKMKKRIQKKLVELKKMFQLKQLKNIV